MRKKRFLSAVLLSIALCFVSGVGYGEVWEELAEIKPSVMQLWLVESQVQYVMNNPGGFLSVNFLYDRSGVIGKVSKFADNTNTTGKIIVQVIDNREEFHGRSGDILLDIFRRHLSNICLDLAKIITDKDADIVAIFYDSTKTPLGYFSEGEYHLWEE